jgi:hypothetical protein
VVDAGVLPGTREGRVVTWPLWVLVGLSPSIVLCLVAALRLYVKGELRQACYPPRSGPLHVDLHKRKGAQ